MELEVQSLEELEAIAQKFLGNLKQSKDGATIVALEGNLGAGKTTFTQICAKILGIKEDITSPTFVILKNYACAHNSLPDISTFVHIDAYRIDDPHELEVLGWDEMKSNPQNLIFIEWPEKVAPILPNDIIKVQFTFIDETTRKITVPDYASEEN